MSLNPLVWLETLVSWVLVSFHSLTSRFFQADSGWAWGLAIVMLVILIRIILIPLFVKQIKSQRNLQIIQPQVKEIQKKYQGDRERQSQELMKLYKETGTNPLSSCSTNFGASANLLRFVRCASRHCNESAKGCAN
jgi:YidC/Oxa1 family membrane protein insertase